MRTLHGQGYRFVAAVEAREHLPVDDAPPALARGSSLLPEQEKTRGTGNTGQGGSNCLLSGREVPDGEHKQVTVLCGALAEAATLAARLGPETMYHLMRAVLALAQDTVQRYGGTLFRSPARASWPCLGRQWRRRAARRAVLAAFELRQRLHAPDALRGQPHDVAAPPGTAHGARGGWPPEYTTRSCLTLRLATRSM